MVTAPCLRDHRHITTDLSDPPGAPAPTHRRHRGRGIAGLTRATNNKVIAGVCSGIARWLGVDTLVVRIAFIVLAFSGGAGVVAYALVWALVPDDRGTRAIDAVHGRFPTDRGRTQRAIAVLLLVVGGLLLARESGLWVGDKFVWPFALAAIGIGLAWPEAAGAAFRRGLGVEESRMALVRVGLGIAAVSGGAVVFVVANASWGEMGDIMLAVSLTIAGLLLIFGPWWWRLGRDLVEERRRRIRSEERAEVAARIHDSVLQTLALIQRRGDDPAEMARLARRQERELRDWLFAAAPSDAGGTLRSAMVAAATEVEDMYGVAVEVVTVGDAPLDDALEAVVAAAKEAMVNASKFAAVGTVDVYVEVGDDAVSTYVRDRGAGFDPAEVPADRKGIAESIRGRMARNGGRAEIRSAPGHGTEVELTLGRDSRRSRS